MIRDIESIIYRDKWTITKDTCSRAHGHEQQQEPIGHFLVGSWIPQDSKELKENILIRLYTCDLGSPRVTFMFDCIFPRLKFINLYPFMFVCYQLSAA